MTIEDGVSSADYSERLRLAGDASTSPAVLAELAQNFPELRPLIAANPAAYDGLLAWMAGFGDAAVIAAIASRAPAGDSAALAVSPAPLLEGTSSAVPVASRTPLRPLRRRHVIAIVAGVAALALVVGGGAFAANFLLSGGLSSATESAKAFPSTTFSWVEAAIDPSINQKLAAVEVLDNLSGVKKAIDDNGPDIDYKKPDLKQSMWTYLFDNKDFNRRSSLDYEKDIQPWLGSRIAGGLVGSAPTGADSIMVAIEASNTDLGVKAVTRVMKDLGIEGFEVSARNGYVIVSDDDLDLKAAYAKGTLADSPAFSAASARLGSWGLGAFWSSPKRAVESNFAWAKTSSDNGELSLKYWEDDYSSSVASWQQDVDAYNATCPRNATFRSSYCRSNSVPSADSFFESYGYYPSDWEAAAKLAQQAAIDSSKKVLSSSQALIDSISDDGAVAGVLRAAGGGVVELDVITSNLRLPEFSNPEHSSALADLPDSTIAAASVSQVGSIVDTAVSPEYFAAGWSYPFLSTGYSSLYSYNSLVSSEGDVFPAIVAKYRDNLADGVKSSFGLAFPKDLVSAFGADTVVAVDKDFSCKIYDFAYSDGDCSHPNAGVLVYSNDVSGTAGTVGHLLDNIDESYDTGVKVVQGDGKVAVARGGYGKTLLEGSGGLGGRAGFASAVPDLGGSFAAAFVDVPAVISEIENQRKHYSDERIDGLKYFDGISTAGLTISKSGNGDVSLKLRIVTGKG